MKCFDGKYRVIYSSRDSLPTPIKGGDTIIVYDGVVTLLNGEKYPDGYRYRSYDELLSYFACELTRIYSQKDLMKEVNYSA
jgi:hypothetical protein